jgi:uncharacterized protein YuzE
MVGINMDKGIFQTNKVKAISADTEARALYITLSSEPVAKTVSKSAYMNIDYDKNGKIIGVELIGIKTAKIKLAVSKAYNDINRILPHLINEEALAA